MVCQLLHSEVHALHLPLQSLLLTKYLSLQFLDQDAALRELVQERALRLLDYATDFIKQGRRLFGLLATGLCSAAGSILPAREPTNDVSVDCLLVKAVAEQEVGLHLELLEVQDMECLL